MNVRLDVLLAQEAYGDICLYLHEHMASADLQESFLCDLLLKIKCTPSSHPMYAHGKEIMMRILNNSSMIKVIPDIMQRHFGNVSIQQQGCEWIDYAFRTNGLLEQMSDEITPCATAVLSAIEEYVDQPAVQYNGCRALHAILQTSSTRGRFPFLGTAGQHVLATLVHKTMFTPQVATEQVPMSQEKMSESCCMLLAFLLPGWKFQEPDGVGEGQSAIGPYRFVDRAITAAMNDFPDNRQISLHGTTALGIMARENLHFFGDVPRCVLNIVNIFQAEYTYVEYQQATSFALTNFARDKGTGKVIPVNQECIGRTCVISLALCALRNHFESNSTKSEIVKVMCNLLDFLQALGVECTANQERMLFTQSPSLLLGIAKMRQRYVDTEMETAALRLLCLMPLNQDSARSVDASWPYDLATWNKSIVRTQGANLMDMTVKAMAKKHANPLLLLDGMRMLCSCASELTKVTRNADANAYMLAVVLTLTNGNQYCDDFTRLSVVLVEMLSHNAIFAANPDMLAILGHQTRRSLRSDSSHCALRNKAIQQIAAHMAP